MARSSSHSLGIFGSSLIMAFAMGSALLVGEYAWRFMLASNIAEQVRNEQTTQALNTLEQQHTPWWLELAARVSDMLEAEVGVTEKWNELRGERWRAGALEEARETISETSVVHPSEELVALQSKQDRLLSDSARLRSTYKLLAAGASELFTLELLDDNEPQFFQSGIIAGLPSLKGITDGVDSLPALSAAVRAAGGNVTDGNFQDTFLTLTTSGIDLERRWNENVEELSSVSKEIKAEERRLISQKVVQLQQLASKIESIQPVIGLKNL